MPKVRLDVLLVERGVAESRSKAQALIMAGQVKVDGQVALKPATPTSLDCRLKIDPGPRFVSRGGQKLDAVLEAFGIDVSGFICADVGASTGGFTDCLLGRGAERVYAIDVGKGLLDWKLRNDTRVVVMEETNARFVEELPEQIDLVTIDASFISLKKLLPVVKGWITPLRPPSLSKKMGGEKEEENGGVIALVKPQFEAGRKEVSRGSGVVRDPAVHRQVLLDLLAFAQSEGYGLSGLIRSPLQGPKGNTEFLAWLSGQPGGDQVETLVAHVLPEEGADEMP
jgi:23S rRNA (cytidine1920-2'-O)/16S rRNA (cytidine1409-2'-O)-methyltransferase